MAERDESPRGFSLSRWSRRKLEASRAAGQPVVPAPVPVALSTPSSVASLPPAVPPAGISDPGDGPPRPDLPTVDSLSFESDFAAFLRPEVDETLRRQALKKLFSDPRFNVMDGLDIYIDDYGKPDPIEPELVRQLVQGRYLFDPPRTRVNEHGVVEEIPVEHAATAVVDAVPGAAAAPVLCGAETLPSPSVEGDAKAVAAPADPLPATAPPPIASRPPTHDP